MITTTDFKIFEDPTLEGRMAKIKGQLDPKFEIIGQRFVTEFETQTGRRFYLHIAKHLRRHKNPPVDTWLAIGEGARGYKMLPHFEIGLWPDQCFVWFALLAEVAQKEAYVQKLSSLPQHLDLSQLMIAQDHTQPMAQPLTEANFDAVVTRYAQIKKGEFLIGQLIPKTDPIFTNATLQTQFLDQTMQRLLTIYEAVNLDF